MRRFPLLEALAAAKPELGGPLLERIQQRMAERLAGLDDGSAGDFAKTRGTVALPLGATVERDLAYGPDPAQRLDVYRPAGAHGAPVILFVHGGGWRRGDKAMPQMIGDKVAHWVGRGHAFVSTNYRMLPAADVLEQADDVARALVCTQSQAASWGCDPARVVLIGHSAGAHLAALITADPAIAMRHGAQPWLATVALDSAALDMVAIMQREHYRFYDPVFGTDPAFWRAASPTHRVAGRPAAPLLLVCSSRRDDSIPPAQQFAAKAARFGGRVEVVSRDSSHRELNEELGAPGEYTAMVDAFLRSVGVP